jgi:hypothetical protein
MHGTLDEIRISNTNRSTDWIKTSYNTQNAPASFYTLYGVEYAPTARRVIIISKLSRKLGDRLMPWRRIERQLIEAGIH